MSGSGGERTHAKPSDRAQSLYIGSMAFSKLILAINPHWILFRKGHFERSNMAEIRAFLHLKYKY